MKTFKEILGIDPVIIILSTKDFGKISKLLKKYGDSDFKVETISSGIKLSLLSLNILKDIKLMNLLSKMDK